VILSSEVLSVNENITSLKTVKMPKIKIWAAKVIPTQTVGIVRRKLRNELIINF